MGLVFMESGPLSPPWLTCRTLGMPAMHGVEVTAHGMLVVHEVEAEAYGMPSVQKVEVAYRGIPAVQGAPAELDVRKSLLKETQCNNKFKVFVLRRT